MVARKRRRSRQEALAIGYRHSSYCRWRFERLYEEHCRREGKLVSRRALETRWVAYRGIVRAYRRRGGQSFFTTNGQRSQQLTKDGRPRCERTVRRVHRDLEAMGVAIVKHKVRSGPACIPGKLDCLAVALLPVSGQSYVRPRFAERRAGPIGQSSPLQRQHQQPSAPPAKPADGKPPDKPAERPGTEEEVEAAVARFAALKESLGWGPRARRTGGGGRASP